MSQPFETRLGDRNPRELFLSEIDRRRPRPVLEIGTLTSVPGRSTHRLH